MQVARVTCEILRPVPLRPLEVVAELVRPGNKVRLARAALMADDDLIMVAHAWQIRRAAMDIPQEIVAAPPPPEAGPAEELALGAEGEQDYLRAMEWRFTAGSFFETGPATAWLRMRHPLVAGEDPSPLTRVLAAADSGNGISAALDFTRYVYVNTDLTVHLHRMPQGEWVCLDSTTTVEPTGIGLAVSALYDRGGRVGHSLQSLYVSERV